MIEVRIDDREVTAALRRLAARTQNLRPVLAEIGELVTRSTKARFGTSTGPDGRRWADLSPVTLARYLDERVSRAVSSARSRAARKDGASAASVYRAGAKAEARALAQPATRRPLIGESKRLSREIAYRVEADSVSIGSSLIYSAVHQFGAKARSFTGGKTPWGDIPARPFLGLSDQDRADILAILTEHLSAP